MGFILDTAIGDFILWSAATVLSIKYSMIAQKVASAITEQNVVKRSNYKAIVIFFAILYSLSAIFFLFVVIWNIVLPNTSLTF